MYHYIPSDCMWIVSYCVVFNVAVFQISRSLLFCSSSHSLFAENYPRGHKELRGSFFNAHGPEDTMSWFSSHGVELKIEDDGRAFLVSNSSSTVIDCLMSEVNQRGVSMQTKKNVTAVSVSSGGKFLLEIKQLPAGSTEHVEVDYLLIASGSNRQGYELASQLGHSIVEPMPSLFTFKIEDLRLRELSGVTFPKVKVRLKLDSLQKNIPQLTQVGPMLVTHWGLSGPAILRLSAWGARFLFSSGYKGKCTLLVFGSSKTIMELIRILPLDEGRLVVDFIPDVHVESLNTILSRHKLQFAEKVEQEIYAILQSTNLDSWTPEQLKLMSFGGNGRANVFFRQHGWNGGGKVEAKYTSRAAELYKQLLSKEVAKSMAEEAALSPSPAAPSQAPQKCK
ncbi:hypothetical protein KIW84_056133 [Lathyrus oleraceus]|uniref:RsdA/BaiN/AoA(So)-like Rossmann fold-like domain-containing protein n=1 Tax=Pisum sativum TaxID=3888 RepID=A0A9D4WZP6_PEA|nr:hypothetical protein KIW84_056133 [Pisum sativum]